jgi:class 3 adenylate cyclase/tetratricopeptide (TPR) repeat protein
LSDQGPEQALREKIDTLRHDLAALMILWQQRREPGIGWVRTPAVYALLARAFVETGAPLLALEVAGEGLELAPADVALRQVQGLALARSGSTEAANAVLESLRAEGHLEDETLGMLARTHKDLGLHAEGVKRHEHLAAALQLYSSVYAAHGSYWAGVNVATLAALQGERELSEGVARALLEDCAAALERLADHHPERYWVLATLGEAALALGDCAQAERWYRLAGEAGRRRFGDLNSTRRHAVLLLDHLGEDSGQIDEWLPLPRVVLFSGHMVDREGRASERFPARLEPAVYATIRCWLEENHGLVGFASAACGADILFLEALLELGGEAHVVLPCEVDEFLAESVEIPGAGDWRERFEQQLANSRVVLASSSQSLIPGLGFDYANQLIQGLGMLRAHELETELVALAVWDGQPGDGPGGTAGAVQQWQAHGVEVHRLKLEAGLDADAVTLGTEVLRSRPGSVRLEAPAGGADDRVLSLLFADAVGFSQLTDAEVPLFVERGLGLVARLISEEEEGAIPVRETWGDGLFLAFRDTRTAGRFALRLREEIAATDWGALGFSHPLKMRFALHAGPVRLTTDPITGLPKCCGTHVSRAARLEPKTPPGEVYASEAFAALATLDRVAEFRCDYVKQLDWAKRYGTFPAYVVRAGRRS